MPDTRREFLKKTALLTGAAGAAQLFPETILRALAISPPEGSTWQDAEHVVMLMQENRSFDHTLGTLRGVRGYNDPRAIRLPNGNPVWLQSNKEGQTYAPFHLDIRNTKATWMDSLPHSWANQVSARNDGHFDQWLEWKRNSIAGYSKMPLTMGYHTRQDLPFYYALADAFTVCDQNFCSALTGTNPNRLYFWTGTVREEQHENSRAHVWNDDMDYGTLKWSTFPERLEALGVSWKCYQNEVAVATGFQGEEDPWLSNFQDNPLEFFAQYNIKLYPPHVDFVKKETDRVQSVIADLKQRIGSLPAGDTTTVPLQEKLDKQQRYFTEINNHPAVAKGMTLDQLNPQQQALHRKAFDTNTGDPDHRSLESLTYQDGEVVRSMKAPKGDVLHQFRKDVETGKLPTVSWLSAPENFSDHPSAPWYGAWYVSEVMDILTHNPEIWKKTIFILAYDENDGYFDHVPPFTAPHPRDPGTGKVSAGIDTGVDYITHAQEQERNGFPEPFDRECSIGLGFRVPLIIASPWTRGGWVNSQVFDHTSTLQFLERFLSHKLGKPVREDNISDWRRLVCGDLTSVFRPYHAGTMADADFLAMNAFLESIHKAQFLPLPSDFTAEFSTRQEPGTKPSCALPYCMTVGGCVSADKSRFEIFFDNNNRKPFGDKTAGAPFNVYAPDHTRAYGVKPGESLSDVWPLEAFEGGKYFLRVYGPNGFFREFRGDPGDPMVGIDFEYERSLIEAHPFTGNGALVVRNRGDACTVMIVDNAYKRDYPLQRVGAHDVATIPILSSKDHGWYDFSVRINGHAAFEQRFAGRIETGNDSISDPYMGNPGQA